MMRRLLATFALLPLLTASTPTWAARSQPLVIYGHDDRREVYESPDAAHRILAESIAAVVTTEDLDTSDDTAFGSVLGINYGQDNLLCPTERFVEQDAVASCTAFLVTDDVVATAGHCVSPGFCTTARFVFGFMKDTPDRNPNRIFKTDIYSCAGVLEHEDTEIDGHDYALIRLDRKVANRKPLTFATKTPAVGESVAVIGYPAGLPAKVTTGATVRTSEKSVYVTNLDAFEGNSGSPVFNENYEVAGILVSGEADFVSRGSCFVSRRCQTGSCSGETVIKPDFVVAALKKYVSN